MSQKKQHDKILDFEYTQGNQGHKKDYSSVFWEGKPCLQILIDHPELDKGRNRRYFYGIIVLILPLLAGLVVYWVTQNLFTGIFILVMSGSFMLAFIPPYFLFNKYLKYNKTRYQITEDSIIFYLDDGYRETKEQLSWEQVRSITISDQPYGLKAIHFLTKSEIQFTSFNFIDKEVRQFPAFELLEDGEKIFRVSQNFHQRKKS